MFDRFESGERAILVHVDFPAEIDREDLSELQLLVSSAGVETLGVVTASRSTPSSKYFVGSGKAEEIADQVKLLDANIVIFNHSLSPTQERNLEKLCECRVLDRTGLILDIFAQRARTHEGKLQVELAQLRHISTRLVRGWTHLERQKGGIGLRGPGETQLETDRRLIRGRIKNILGRLEKVQKQREQGRRARQRAEIPTVSLVGYTNAGKSTLFNRITESQVYAADQLFATLDPTLRKLELPDVGSIILADTVGFIRHLPHELVAAFKATLQETQEADLLLHVIDIADERQAENMQQVQDVLHEIGADEIPQLLICNKIDKLADGSARIDTNDEGLPIRVWLSAQTGDGIDLLQQALVQRLRPRMVDVSLRIPPSMGKLRGKLYAMKSVTGEEARDDGQLALHVRMSAVDWQRLSKQVAEEYGDSLQGFVE
ncbi:ribosome rescue GTPase HflX [Pseudidiomarina andamanensis]|uniref:GTPase HflX n=1 Tax=Pseudidiomarina andamanensis TaxID=1940690 RepID=A0AA92EVE6_9GAMM|nr:ribosome rescue GTPase HflX [Pseudidiomarina andamanensis]MDS0219155.1 GTPase HflX [Pseudidiomarina andamanensis]QGT96501.1 GTPase HflX [Pseudidiomarina andamanensis]